MISLPLPLVAVLRTTTSVAAMLLGFYHRYTPVGRLGYVKNSPPMEGCPQDRVVFCRGDLRLPACIKEFTIKTFKKFLPYFTPYRFLIAVTVLLSAVAAAVDAGLAYIVKPVMDGIFIDRRTEMLKILPFAIVGLYTAKSLLRFALGYSMRYMGLKVVQHLRNELYSKIIYLPIRFFSDSSTGELMSRTTNDVNLMQASLPTIIYAVRDALTVIGLIFVVFYMNPKMAVIAMLVYPIFIHPLMLLSKRIRRYSKKGQEEMAVLTGVLQESFSGIRVVKAFAQEQKEVNKFEKSNEKVVKFSLKSAIAAEITSPMMEIVASFGIAGIVFFGGMQVINGDITPGAFFAFMAAVTMMYEPVKRLGKANAVVQSALAAGERVFAMLETRDEILENDGHLKCNAKDKPVEFRNVSFKYAAELPHVLRDINLTVAPGLKVAFVGHSGAGKSTIANLIPRFYDVTEGAIYIDGIDLRDYTSHSLRENIGYVTQEPFLFNDTIFNNVAYSSVPHTLAEVEEACRAAYVHDFVLKLPEGYETVIGERGVRLSGGQKQRLTIARALLKNPPILILDEATSSLDTESEREVQKALDNLMLGRTSFIIAHRLSTIINADIIVVLEHGEIRAVGKHAKLLETCETYKSLYNMQTMI